MQRCLTLSTYLGLHLPAGDGGLAIVAWLEEQRDGAWPDVGDGQVGGRTGELCVETRRRPGFIRFLPQLPPVAVRILQ